MKQFKLKTKVLQVKRKELSRKEYLYLKSIKKELSKSLLSTKKDNKEND